MQAMLTQAIRAKLIANRAKSQDGSFDPAPVVKLFNPCGGATWLATELYEDGDTLFGIADMGFGTPEMGVFSMAELRSIRLPFGLYIERDIHFETTTPLSKWAELARSAQSIMGAADIISRMERQAA